MRPPISRSSRRPRPGWRFGQSWRETGTHDEPHAPGASEIVPTATDPPPVPPTGVPRPGPQPETAPGEATGPESPGWIPGGTYRLQFHKEFTLGDARGLLPYLKALGITHIYTSPLFKALPGSPHGYDICDQNRINPEIGSREGLEAFHRALAEHGIGLVLDFVPNHMGVGPGFNRWWTDVLENGPSSAYAAYFDIEWHPLKRELENKVLLPILGDQYGRVLEQGHFELRFERGAFFLCYLGRILPLEPSTLRPILAEVLSKLSPPHSTVADELASILTGLEHLPPPTERCPNKMTERAREKEIIKSRLFRLCQRAPAVEALIRKHLAGIESGGRDGHYEALDALLNRQAYRLAYWRVAAEEINYRRFFDVNDLAALRMELPEVFEATHGLVLELIANGTVQGLRIDHVDGLADPRAYLDTLRARILSSGGAAPKNGFYLVVEKILAPGEKLQSQWPVQGTTGYEFGAQVTELLIQHEAEAAFDRIYEKFTGQPSRFGEVVYRGKLLTMRAMMASDINALGAMLNRLSETHRWYRDFTLNALTTAVREVIACFSVYRTYLRPESEPGPEDTRVIHRAIRAARRRNPALERTVFEFVRDMLIPPRGNPHPVNEGDRRAFVAKFQQCTGAIAAKGVEDTAFYVYNRLVALNEVGSDPSLFGQSLERFHEFNRERQRTCPHGLLATSTHDSKRSEDVRARIAGLSELAPEWSRALRHWRALNAGHHTPLGEESAPDANEEYLFYQTLLGTWPMAPLPAADYPQYIRRIQAYMRKALAEAKTNSSWIEPNEEWEAATDRFVEQAMDPAPGNRFLAALKPMADQVAQLGCVNALSQIVLKLTCPGVPDFYQGQELWDLSLVDPDNRRPVDYGIRQRMLAAIESGADPEELLRHWRDGRIKLWITHRLLQARREFPEVFAHGTYEPIPAEGAFAACCVAFERRTNAHRLLVIVPRLTARLGFPPTGAAWADSRIASLGASSWRNLITGTSMEFANEPIPMSVLLERFPIAVLAASNEPRKTR